MLSTKRSSIGPVILLVLAIFSLLMPVGCGGKNAGTGTPIHSPIFSEIDAETLNSAYDEYSSFRKTLSSDQAIEQLMKSLSDQTQKIKNVKLGDDGYTLFVDFSDGDSALIDTLQADELITLPASREPSSKSNMQEGSTSNSPLIFKPISEIEVQPHQTQNLSYVSQRKIFEAPSHLASPLGAITPASKKVLLLGPDCWLDSQLETEERAKLLNALRSNGWTPADIVEKLVTKSPNGANTSWLTINPVDYFNWGDYGVVLFYGHGNIKTLGDESQMFIQFCFLDDNSFLQDRQLLEWKGNGLIKVVRAFASDDHSTTIYQMDISLSLLRQKLSPLSQSYVQLATCYSSYFYRVFLDKGAQVFVGWDDTVTANLADENIRETVELMVGKSFSAFEAYNDQNITKQDPQYKASYVILPDQAAASSYYLPAWIDLKVKVSSQFSGLMTGYPGIDAYVLDENSKNVASTALRLSPGQTEAELIIGNKLNPIEQYLLPGHYKLSVGARNSDYSGLLAAGNMEVDLHCGANNIPIQLTDLKWTDDTYEGPPGWVGAEPTGPTATPTIVATTTPTTTPTNLPTTSPASITTPTITPTITSTTKPPQTRLKELSNDDGVQEGWVSLGGKSQWGFLVRFTTSPSFNVTKVRIYNKIKGPPIADSKFTVRITDKELNPKWEVSLPMTLFTTDPSWFDIQVPELTVKDAFCVLVYAPSLGQGLGPYIGVDESGANLGSETLSGWQIVPWVAAPAKETSNWMIRAVGYEMTP
jgi:hypothetical protein